MQTRIAELEARLAAAEAAIKMLTERLENRGTQQVVAPFRVVDNTGRIVCEIDSDLTVYPSFPCGNTGAAGVIIGVDADGGFVRLHSRDAHMSACLGTLPEGGFLDIINTDNGKNVVTLCANDGAGTLEVIQTEPNQATNETLPDGAPMFCA